LFRKYEQSWEDSWDKESQSKKINPGLSLEGGKSKKILCVAENLNPGCSYCVRLLAHDVNGDIQGDPGPELIIDTEAVSCTPKAKTCIIC